LLPCFLTAKAAIFIFTYLVAEIKKWHGRLAGLLAFSKNRCYILLSAPLYYK
jgi:hypothetical protein